ncbi:hypothetical protein K437DRAFT_257851 [Tilletiaria anomala UBC 951]|uniref:Uncharacterized protein n=1 Tax=Tilletiaria anomala (strain ATCC 24038 / CBS 436.72 / UBC 951) TaxID=1037660 RepID=A0A066VUM1_TILAU|nr:uncharacterized protein K437DRAFT_257851 [Tilletiaria anomala UBC 951]KDN42509.1 hypothetical protein K437DRAFT_257851 [Tilletiaria anomala UBC 951]
MDRRPALVGLTRPPVVTALTACTRKLPPELIYLVGQQLFDLSTHASARPGCNCCCWCSADDSPFLPDEASQATLTSTWYASTTPRDAKRALLNLSSVDWQLRALLAPLVWHQVVLKQPSDTIFLRNLAQRYAVAPHAPNAQAAAPQLPRPLTHVSSLCIAFSSDRYPGGVEQSTLLDLLSRHQLGSKGPLRSLRWSAETLPIPSLWLHLAPTLQCFDVDCKTFWGGHPNLSRLTNLRALRLTGYDAHLLPPHLPALLLALTYVVDEQDQQGLDGDHNESMRNNHARVSEILTLKRTFPMMAEEEAEYALSVRRAIRETGAMMLSGDEDYSGPHIAPPPGGQDLEIQQTFDAVDAAAAALQPRISGGHEHGTGAEGSEAEQDEADGIAVSASRRASRLLHLSLSTSKTSLLHSTTLIEAGAFRSLATLDIYPVTPEPPLDAALRSAGGTLRILKLALDISSAFRHYDRLWARLTGGMRALEQLHLDPHPQQNTAPSFGAFVQSCAKLQSVDGRVRSDAVLPDLGAFQPDYRTGTIFC